MSAFDRSAAVGFSLNPVNRLSEKRQDAAYIAGRRDAENVQFLLFVGEVPVLQHGERKPAINSPGKPGDDYPRHAFFSGKAVAALGTPGSEIFLGEDSSGQPLFAVQMTDVAAQAITQRDDLEMIDLRSIATRGLVDAAVLGELGGAKAVFSWHQRHKFCANCGAVSQMASAGWRRDCAACNTQHFPRVDPVVIMLATDGDFCLLGRQPRFATGMYSALAGFLEPGETVEDAVRREIHEEAGVSCAEVRYFASQPWPFPSSLMIGCFARATGRELRVDYSELEDARWFSREEVVTMLAGTHPDGLSAPKPFAIAHHLLTAFAEEGATF